MIKTTLGAAVAAPSLTYAGHHPWCILLSRSEEDGRRLAKRFPAGQDVAIR